ncbi:MAG: sodium/solute symporter [Planctomycetota bacterium]
MEPIDIIVFVVFALAVVGIGLFKSRGEKDTAEDYFLAGRGLTWPLIGISLIAANISAEQMVGMSGQAANGEMGLAIASYEWMAAITLIIVGFTFLPTFLKAGIYTIPQFLDYRYGATARTVMSILMFITFVLVNISTVTYLGAKFLDPFINVLDGAGDIVLLSWIVAVIAGVYIVVGGLKASAWADLIQGTALVLGGAVVAWMATQALGDPDPAKGMNSPEQVAQMLGVSQDASIGERLSSLKEDHMSMFLPSTHNTLAWTTLLVGLWIPNLYYWGLNQYIVQRTLGAKSLKEGQKGIVFAAALKLVIPFVVCVPGIMAFTLYSGQMAAKADDDSNKDALVQLDAMQSGDATAMGVFLYDDDFASRSPDVARQIFEYHVSVAKADPRPLIADALGWDIDVVPSDVTTDDLLNAATYELREDGTLDIDGKLIIDPQDAKPRSEGEVLAAANDAAADLARPLILATLAEFDGASTQRPGDVTETDSDEEAEPVEFKAEPDRLVGFDHDDAFPVLVARLVPVGFKGFVIAAVMGAVVSSLASMMNAASTLFTMDLYNKFIKKDATQKQLVWTGRLIVVVSVVIGAIVAPFINNPALKGAFTFIQEFQGFISPGILTIFLFGLFVPKTPRIGGVIGLVMSPVIYGALFFLEKSTASMDPGSLFRIVVAPFPNRMGITLIAISLVLGVLTVVKPLKEPLKLPDNPDMDTKGSSPAKIGGIIVVVLTVALYAVFA